MTITTTTITTLIKIIIILIIIIIITLRLLANGIFIASKQISNKSSTFPSSGLETLFL